MIGGAAPNGLRADVTFRLTFTVFVYPAIYWPVGIALGLWIFYEIARRR